MPTPEQLNDLRRRVLNNEPFTEEEYTAAVKQMVAARVQEIAAPTPKTKAKAVSKPVASLDDLLPR